MRLSLLDVLLWAAGFLANAALLSTLVYRRRYHIVPWFTVWIAFGIAYTVVLVPARLWGTPTIYADVYWSGAFLDLLLQLAVVLEIANAVFRRDGRWVQGSRNRLLLVGLCGPLLGGVLAWQITPAATSALDAWDSRASLFTTIVLCVLFAAVLIVSQQVGVGWRDIFLREGYGLIGIALVAFVTDTLHAYWRTIEHFSQLEYVRMAAYLLTLAYWTVIFWIPESELPQADARTNKQFEVLRRQLE